MNNYLILDLDGTIADDRRRLPLIDMAAPDPWAAYHEECDSDPIINEHCVTLAKEFSTIVLTARPESVREKTNRWLRETVGIKPKLLLMRPEGDLRLSPELKAAFLKQLEVIGIKLCNIALAIDDREDVLSIYDKNRIPTMLVTYPQ